MIGMVAYKRIRMLVLKVPEKYGVEVDMVILLGSRVRGLEGIRIFPL